MDLDLEHSRDELQIWDITSTKCRVCQDHSKVKSGRFYCAVYIALLKCSSTLVCSCVVRSCCEYSR